MTEVNPVNFRGIKIKGPDKKNEKADIMIKQHIKAMSKKLHAKAERAVPEYGDFSIVYEEFQNPDNKLSASDFLLKIYKPKNAENPKTRYLEAVAYKLPTPFKAESLLLEGNKAEILKKLQDEKFLDELNDTFIRLSKNLEDV